MGIRSVDWIRYRSVGSIVGEAAPVGYDIGSCEAAKDSGGALQSEADALERDCGSCQSFDRNVQSLASTQEALESWKQNQRKAVALAADFLHDMYGGIYDTALAAMNIDECKDPSQVDWSTVKGLTQFEPMVRFFRSAGAGGSPCADQENFEPV